MEAAQICVICLENLEVAKKYRTIFIFIDIYPILRYILTRPNHTHQHNREEWKSWEKNIFDFVLCVCVCMCDFCVCLCVCDFCV